MFDIQRPRNLGKTGNDCNWQDSCDIYIYVFHQLNARATFLRLPQLYNWVGATKGFGSTWGLYTMKISSQIHSTIASPRALRAQNKRAESPSRGCWEPLGASKHRIQRGPSCVICSVYLLIINIVHFVHTRVYIYIHIYINRYRMLRTYGNEQIPPICNMGNSSWKWFMCQVLEANYVKHKHAMGRQEKRNNQETLWLNKIVVIIKHQHHKASKISLLGKKCRSKAAKACKNEGLWHTLTRN